jgi:hypothetical protein
VRVIDDVTVEECVLPAGSDGRAGWDVDNNVGDGLSVRVDTAIADEVVRVDIFNRLSMVNIH